MVGRETRNANVLRMLSVEIIFNSGHFACAGGTNANVHIITES